MSTKNFIPTIWSASIFQQLDRSFVYANLANRSYEGEIRQWGDKVVINEIGDVAVSDYTGTITYTDVEDASKLLEITERKYAAKQINNIDQAQAKPKYVQEVTRKMGVAMANSVDAHLASLYVEAGLVSGTNGTPIEINSSNVTEYFGVMGKLMNEANCPDSGRVAVIPAWLQLKLQLAKIEKDTNNSRVLETGYFGNYMGFEIYMSNNVNHSGTDWYAPMFFLRNDTIALAEQITETRAIEDKDSFDDYLSSLLVFGAKVTRSNSLGVLYCSEAAEA